MNPLCFIRVIYEANCTAAKSQQSPQMERVVKMTKLHSLQMFFSATSKTPSRIRVTTLQSHRLQLGNDVMVYILDPATPSQQSRAADALSPNQE